MDLQIGQKQNVWNGQPEVIKLYIINKLIVGQLHHEIRVFLYQKGRL